MRHYTLFYSCHIDASVEEVCAFHTDTHNLPLITPPSIQVKIVSIDGNIVVLDIKKFGVTTRWEIEVEKQCPQSIVDVMRKGPFSYFRHERNFISEGQHRTRMEETITLALPMPLIGNLFFWFVKKDMDTMFAYRHKMTKAHFRFEKEAKKL